MLSIEQMQQLTAKVHWFFLELPSKTVKTTVETSVWIVYGFLVSSAVFLVNPILRDIIPERSEHLLQRGQLLLVGEAIFIVPIILMYLAYWLLFLTTFFNGKYRIHLENQYVRMLQHTRKFFGVAMNLVLGTILSILILSAVLPSNESNGNLEIYKIISLLTAIYTVVFFLVGNLLHMNKTVIDIEEKFNFYARLLIFLLMIPGWLIVITFFLASDLLLYGELSLLALFRGIILQFI